MEGFSSVVIATDSYYVVQGATDRARARAWTRNQWKTTNGDTVKNKDLWELLLGEFEKCHDGGLGVELWHIPRDWHLPREMNGAADAAAKKAKKAATSDIPGLKLGSRRGPRVLALCLESEGMFDAIWPEYVSNISSKASLERAKTQEAAFAILEELAPPSIILVTDAALSRCRRVWERVIDHLRAGATVVVAGCFSCLTSPGEFRRFFAKVGLPWQMAQYSRETVDLRPGAVGNSRLASRLPVAYSQKAVFLKGADSASTWYASSDDPAMAAVAFTKVGNGKLGYIGDVNGEWPSAMVGLAMCGLLG